MCGRYYRRSDKQRIAEAFFRGQMPEDFVMPPDFNIAPATFQPVIRQNRDTGGRELVMMRWGLVPYFAKSLADFKGFSTINARAETVQGNAMWRGPFERRRCLVPADGFYEWMKLDAKTKKPYAFAMRDALPFAFAGLWDTWRNAATNDWLQSFSIITAEPNELTAEVHTRMPVILHAGDYDRWLERSETERPPLDLLRPYEADAMTASACNQLVGNPRNNGPEMLNSA